MNESTFAHADRGFTLLEVLIVMVLLSVIMTGLLSALRTMGQTETRIDQQLERLDQIRVARAFLQQTLTRVSGVLTASPGAIGGKAIPFSATGDSVTWVGILPARPDVGGRHFFRLAVEDTGSGPALVLRYAPWHPDASAPNWIGADSRVLLRNIVKIAVQAQGLPPQSRNPAEPWPRGWQEGWPVTDALPDHLRVIGHFDNGRIFPLTTALYALPGGDIGVSRVTFGGGAR